MNIHLISSGGPRIFSEKIQIITINHVPVNLEYKRGLNVAIFDSAGKLRNFDIFETHALSEESDRFTHFINKYINPGDMVAILAIDEVSARLTSTAKDKLKELGAELIDKLGYRGPYIFCFKVNADKKMESKCEKLGPYMTTISVTLTFETCAEIVADESASTSTGAGAGTSMPFSEARSGESTDYEVGSRPS